ncbi:MAG: hypothetical protein H6502_05280 [Candidatus Woesearchaeota archaeon]|nr:MAG: hypothetical protein H6502_05280 [Candidatus Woesearchaeota archaeon]
MNAKKFHIIGGPGSGKSYLGKELSKLLKINYYNLDKIYYGYSNNSERIKELNKIIGKKEWIIEGHWCDWVKKGFASSNTIIFLDLRLLKRDLNLFKRLFKRTFNLEKGRKLNFGDFVEMLKLSHQWNRVEINKTVEKYSNKTIMFKKADFALDYMKSK